MKLSSNYKQIIILILLILVSFLAACLYFAFLFCFHEKGHIFFGSVGNLFTYGQLGEFQITRWNYISFPLPGNNSISLPMLVPTQISPQTLVPGTIWIAFGGIIAVSCLTLMLSYGLYKFVIKGEKLKIIIITIVIILSQIITNSICGTDNLTQTPFISQPLCNNIVITLRWFVLFALFVLFLITAIKFQKTSDNPHIRQPVRQIFLGNEIQPPCSKSLLF
jgi:hypothetical protein